MSARMMENQTAGIRVWEIDWMDSSAGPTRNCLGPAYLALVPDWYVEPSPTEFATLAGYYGA